MRHVIKSRPLLALAILPIIGLSACSAATSQGASSSAQPAIQIAYLSASSANTYLAASRVVMNKLAAEDNVKLTEFDGKFTPSVQTKQIQDVISSGRYKGIILATADGVGIQPSVKEALKAGLKVVVLNQLVGTRFDTANPQVNGISASVLAPPIVTGERVGKLTAKACEKLNPCQVAYLFGAKGSPYDNAVRLGFDKVVGSNVHVIAEGESGFLGTAQPLKATQDIIQAHPKFDVLAASSDQGARGAALALADANLKKVKIIGVGGSVPAIAGIKDGTWFGDVALVPTDEARLAFNAMVAAVRDGKNEGGIDPVSKLPDDGLITKLNVSKFSAQWAG